MRTLRIDRAFALVLLVLCVTSSSAQTFSVLYEFGINGGDPLNLPQPGQPFLPDIVAQGRNGNLYSTTDGGGASWGAVFEITPQGALATLYDFSNGNDGAYPFSGLALGSDGNFYGTTSGSTTSNHGTVFKITPRGTQTILYTFTGGRDGGRPFPPPILGTDGSLYGTTSSGGSNNCGTVYKITPEGNLTTLHYFDCVDGSEPVYPLVQGTDGNFYGTTYAGGTNNRGTIFKVTPTEKFTTLYNCTDSEYRPSQLIQGTDGAFYGTGAGYANYGDIFRITATGSFTALHYFDGADGVGGLGLVQATDGRFYGVSPGYGAFGYGNIYRFTPHGFFSVLHNLDETSAAFPATLMQHTNGLFYGDTYGGGVFLDECSGGCGVLYSLNVGLEPFVSLVNPSGKVAATVQILGQGLTGTTGVSFNGTAATFKVQADTFMTATVPAGATTGPVKVTTPSGTLTSIKKFRVTPQVLYFNPPNGPVGTRVTITGVSFTQTLGVGFGDRVPASFTVNSDSSVTATVPAGAKTGPVGVETQGGTGVSSQIFTVTH